MIESFNFKTHENFMSKIKYDFELSKYTWFQTGGKALCYCLINNSIDLQYILKQIPKEKRRVFFVQQCGDFSEDNFSCDSDGDEANCNYIEFLDDTERIDTNSEQEFEIDYIEKLKSFP